MTADAFPRGGLVLGAISDCSIAVVAGDLVDMEADIAIAALLEADGAPLSGALSSVDRAMGGAINRLRSNGLVGGGLCETLLISTPSAPVRAASVMVLGLGRAEQQPEHRLRRGLRRAAEQACHVDARQVAFAPIDLVRDGSANAGVRAAAAMLRGISDGLEGRTAIPIRWSFVVEAAKAGRAVQDFKVAFAAVSEQ